ncbi:MAG: Two component regulator propeller [Elusimicrobia bacterium ADurb.Bin231]|nr:MAG: Two component regulator propeller [Elusimicrobia bacterium ADurb.Bin231]
MLKKISLLSLRSRFYRMKQSRFFALLFFTFYLLPAFTCCLYAATIIGTDVTPAPTGDWVNYTNPNYVQCVGREGNYLWMGTAGGVVKWNTTNDTYRLYTTIDGLANNDVNSIAIDSAGNKWFGTNSGVSKFDGTNWTTYTTANGLADNDVNSIAIDSSGNKWFGTYGGVSKFDGTSWVTYSTSTSGLANNPVVSIVIDSSGNKWSGTWSCGVSKFDGTNWTTYNTSNSGLVSNYVGSIAIDSSVNIWVTTEGGGVSKFDGTTWTTYNTASGLTNNWVNSIAIDDSGNKWFGTDGGGVSKFDGTTWTTYNTASGLADNYVKSIAIDSAGNKWFGTGGGVSMLKAGAANPTYYIKGYVKDSGGVAISGVTVNLTGASQGLVTTGSNGYYEFTNLASGNYTVTPSKTDYSFSPANKSYSPLAANQDNQDFTGTYTAPANPVQPSVISVSASSLDFGKVKKGESKTQTFTITNPGGGTLSGAIESSQSWIQVSPSTFTANSQTVSVTVNNAILDQSKGQYSGTISITSNGGDSTIAVSVTATCVLTKPNPYNPKSGQKLKFFGSGVVPNDTKIRIFTVSGKPVKTLTESQGLNEIEWDGKNEDGDEVVNGIYLFVSESPAEKSHGKFTVVKK